MSKNSIFQIIRDGHRRPTAFIEAINLPWRPIWRLSLLLILIMTGSLVWRAVPLINGLERDIQQAAQHVVDYQIDGTELRLANNTKPVYYQSDNFQLVMDDTVHLSGTAGQESIPHDKASLINPNIPLNLFLFKNQALAVWLGMPFQLNDFYRLYTNSQILRAIFQSVSQLRSTTYISLIIASLIMAFIAFWFLTFFATLLFRLAIRTPRFVRFHKQMRLVIAVMAVPLTLLELVNCFFATGFTGYVLILFYTVAMCYFATMRYAYLLRQQHNEQPPLNIEINEHDTYKDIERRIREAVKEYEAEQKTHLDDAETKSADESAAQGDINSEQVETPADTEQFASTEAVEPAEQLTQSDQTPESSAATPPNQSDND